MYRTFASLRTIFARENKLIFNFVWNDYRFFLPFPLLAALRARAERKDFFVFGFFSPVRSLVGEELEFNEESKELSFRFESGTLVALDVIAGSSSHTLS